MIVRLKVAGYLMALYGPISLFAGWLLGPVWGLLLFIFFTVCLIVGMRSHPA